MGRKTINVKALVDHANMMLKESVTDQGQRRGVQAMIEEVLHRSGNYKGFRYLMQEEVPYGHLPGIHMDTNGRMLPYLERFEGTDSSRVEYGAPV
jgi:acetylglutamate synthase